MTKSVLMKLKVKEVLREKGMTIAKVAEKLEIGPSALTQSINGNPSFNRLCEIADVVGCSVADFIDDEKSSGIVTCPHCGKKFRMVPVDE